MPALSVLGVPKKTPKKKLRKLRAKLIATAEKEMGIKAGITRVFFPIDMLGDPDEGQDDQVWVFLFTGMLKDKSVEEAKRVTDAIAVKVKKAFKGKYGVEVFVIHLDLATRALLHAN